MATSKEYIILYIYIIYIYNCLVCTFFIDSDTVDGKNPFNIGREICYKSKEVE